MSFYEFALSVHITSAILAFGVTFAYPFLYAALRRGDARHAAWFHRAQDSIGRFLITPGLTLILLAGTYLALEGPYDFGDAFVSAGIAIVVFLLGLGGAYFAPRERRLAELAERDLAGDSAALSSEYEALARQVQRVGLLGPTLATVAVFLMVTKPGV
jgi:uncharacterized membrane protein